MSERSEKIERISPVSPDKITRVELPFGGTLLMEEHENTEVGIRAYVGHHGDPWAMDEVRAQARRLYGDSHVASDTGFDPIYRTQKGLEQEEGEMQNIAAGAELVKKTIEGNEIYYC